MEKEHANRSSLRRKAAEALAGGTGQDACSTAYRLPPLRGLRYQRLGGCQPERRYLGGG